jgi:methylglyoxal synthase
LEWGLHKTDILSEHELFATGTTGKVIAELFSVDQMSSQPPGCDVKALLRMSVLYNIPTACNCSTAGFIISIIFFHRKSAPD